MGKKYINFGVLNKRRDKEGFYIKIDRDLDLVVNGHKVQGYINVDRPTRKYDNMLEKGKITQEEYDAKVALFDSDGKLSHIRQELTVVVED